MNKLNEIVTSLNYRIVSNEQVDNIVIVLAEKEEANEHATWLYNTENETLFSGNYFSEKSEAMKDYQKRVEKECSIKFYLDDRYFRKQLVSLFFDKVNSYWVNELETALSNISYEDFEEKIKLRRLHREMKNSPLDAIDYLLDILEQ